MLNICEKEEVTSTAYIRPELLKEYFYLNPVDLTHDNTAYVGLLS
jgi:hypothetical protein